MQQPPLGGMMPLLQRLSQYLRGGPWSLSALSARAKCFGSDAASVAASSSGHSSYMRGRPGVASATQQHGTAERLGQCTTGQGEMRVPYNATALNMHAALTHDIAARNFKGPQDSSSYIPLLDPSRTLLSAVSTIAYLARAPQT